MDISRSLSASVTPVVLISACGLITLALYNRLGAILARLRVFHQQKLDLLKSLRSSEPADAQQLFEMVDLQIVKVTRKAKTVRNGLYCLLSAVVAFLFCSLFAAASVMREELSILALTAHIVGLLLFVAGVCWAICELMLSIAPVDDQSNYLETAFVSHFAKLHGDDESTAHRGISRRTAS
jgi:hypothetical protein